jgi:hypothetical protein
MYDIIHYTNPSAQDTSYTYKYIPFKSAEELTEETKKNSPVVYTHQISPDK